MDDDNNARNLRSLLQLAQATYAVFEREIPEDEGLPPHGLVILRLLRWHGPKTANVIADFAGLPIGQFHKTVARMIALGYVKRAPSTSDAEPETFELAPGGLGVARRIVAAQRSRIRRAAEQLPSEHRAVVADMLDLLALGLLADSPSTGIVCAECWAFDARECTRLEAMHACVLRHAQLADLDPDLSEGPDDHPGSRSDPTPQVIELGTESGRPA